MPEPERLSEDELFDKMLELSADLPRDQFLDVLAWWDNLPHDHREISNEEWEETEREVSADVMNQVRASLN